MYLMLWLFFDSYYLSCPFAFLALFNLPINFKVFNLHFCIRRAATETTTTTTTTMLKKLPNYECNYQSFSASAHISTLFNSRRWKIKKN